MTSDLARPLRILLFDTDGKTHQPLDVALAHSTLSALLERIDSLPALQPRLAESWDLIFLAYPLALMVLPWLPAAPLAAPCILLCTPGDETAACAVADERIHDVLTLPCLHRLPLILRRASDRRHLTAKLLTQERQLRFYTSLQESMSEAVIVTDMASHIQSWNKAAERIYGWSAAEVLGKAMADVVHTQYPTTTNYAQPLQQLRAQGWWQSELIQQRKDGARCYVLSSAALVHDETGVPIGVVAVNRDITERKQAEEALHQSRARYRLLAEHVTDVITILGPDGVRKYVTPSVYQLTGYRPEELVGRHVAESMHPEDGAKTLALRQQAISARAPSYTTTIRLRHKAGHYVWSESKVSLLYDATGALLESVTVSRDITARLQTETALQQALAKEKELSDLKSRFVAMASHEFRTPLATILLATEVLSAYRQRLPDEKIAEKLNRIKEQVVHLKAIMEDVLLLAQMQARRVTFQPVRLDLAALCATIIDEFQDRPDHQHELTYHCTGPQRPALLDTKLIQQLISNLVANAIKYSPDAKAIQVDLLFTATTVIFRVQDEGIGIPAADLPYLFTPFHRANNVGTISGTGLGLVIAKEAVDLHGGAITVESHLGVGTTFMVTLPLDGRTVSVG